MSRSSLKIDEDLGKKSETAADLCNIGTFYITLKRYKEAEDYLMKAMKLAEDLGIVAYTKEIEEALSLLYSKTNRFDLALEHYKRSIIARDKITNEENIKKQTQTEMQFEFDKKEAITKAEQEKKNVVQQEEKRKQRIILFSVSVFLLLTVLFAWFIYKGYRQKKKANVEISLQKQIIEEKQKDILDSIHYARRIQRSLLPTESYINKNINRLNRK